LSGSRGGGENAQGGDRVHHSFRFSPPKRERKLSGEDQVKTKRSKSPMKEDVQQAEQHGSGGEGGDEMETEIPQLRFGMTKEQVDRYANAMQQEYNEESKMRELLREVAYGRR
jgi:hypothetical protein